MWNKWILLAGLISLQGPYNEKIVFQPQFHWMDNSCSVQGTGSFVKGPDGSVVALTSAHFVDFSGPQLLRVEYLETQGNQSVASSTKCWGLPGKEGSYAPLDLKSDYLLMKVEGKTCPYKVLEVDDRKMPEIEELIWFPNKNSRSKIGYDWVKGKVIQANENYHAVILDKEINLKTRSGTPVLGKNNKIIGILTGKEEKNGRSVLYLAPASSIREALMHPQSHPTLEQVIGR